MNNMQARTNQKDNKVKVVEQLKVKKHAEKEMRKKFAVSPDGTIISKEEYFKNPESPEEQMN